MSIFAGPVYNKRGGDEALQRRYDSLRRVAAWHGVEREASIPTRAKNFALTALDLVLRPNYAISGAADVLSGTAAADETVGGRVLRELFSGIGGLEGEKETFGNVLEQAGVGRGPALDSILGDNWLTQRFNPDARGVMGLVLDVGLDPLTYVTFGVGGAAKIVGRAGAMKYLNKAGRKALEDRTIRHMLDDAVGRGILGADDAVELAAKRGQRLADVEREIILTSMKDSNLRLAGQWGRSTRVQQYAQEASFELFEEGVEGLTTERALRLFGKSVVPLKPLDSATSATLNFLAAGIRNLPKGEGVLRGAKMLRESGSNLFHRIPFNARQLEGFEQLAKEHFAVRSSAHAIASRTVREEVLRETGLNAKMLRNTDSPVWHTLSRALDNPDKWLDEWIRAADGAGIGAQAAHRLWENFRDLYSREFGIESHAQMGLIRSGIQVENYSPHIFRPGAIDEALVDSIERSLGGEHFQELFGVGRFARQRKFQTYDQMDQMFKVNGVDQPLEQIVQLDPLANAIDRTEAHLKAIFDHEFVRDTLATYATSGPRVLTAQTETVLRHTASMLTDLGLPPEKLSAVNSAVHTWKTNPARAKSLVRSMPKHMQAAFLGESLMRVKDLDELGRFMGEFGEFVGRQPRRYMNALQKSLSRADIPNVGLEGVQYVNWTANSGALKGQTWRIPKGAAEGLEKLLKESKRAPKELKPLLDTVDLLTNFFKVAVTLPWMAFHARNAMSNVFQSSADIGLRAADPVMHYHAMKVLLTKADGAIKTKSGRTITYQELRNEMVENGVNLGFADLAELTGSKATGLEKVLQKMGPFNPQNIENEARGLHYLVKRIDGHSPQDAAIQMKKFLFDYGDLSDAEKSFFKRVFPFWTWNSKNIRLQLENLLKRPGRIAAQAKLVPSESGPEADLLPEYLRGSLNVRLSTPPGKKAAFLTGFDIPVANMDLLWAGGWGETFREWIGMMNPLVKAPLEIALDMDSFTGRSIKGEQWIGRMGPVLDANIVPQDMKDWLQLKKHPNGKYTANGLRVYMLTKTTALSRFVSSSALVTDLINRDQEGQIAGWVQFFSGMNFRDVELSEAQRIMLRNNIERMEEYLLSTGRARTFEKVLTEKVPQ